MRGWHSFNILKGRTECTLPIQTNAADTIDSAQNSMDIDLVTEQNLFVHGTQGWERYEREKKA